MARARLGFRARVTLRWTLGFSTLLAVLLLLTYLIIHRTTYRDLDRHLRTLAATEVASATDGPVNPHVHELPVIVLAGGTFTEKTSVVFDRTHRIVASSPDPLPFPHAVPQVAIDAAFAGDAPVVSTSMDGKPVRLVVVRMIYQDAPYALAVAVGITEHLDTLAGIRGLLILVWGLGTLATAGLGFLLASHVLRPVQALTRRALSIAETDLQARVEGPDTADEVADMTASLNALLARLGAALEANRRFAADAAHELRSPVTAVTGEIDVALRRERTAEEYRDTLALVRTRMATLASLIEDLLVLVRAQERGTVTREPLDLAEQVGASIRRLSGAATAKGVRVETDGLDGLVVYGEVGLLARVLDNLIDNAIRYNRPGGRVRVHARLEPARPGAWQPDVVVLSIDDSGHGIPAALRERVFERFFRVDSSRTRGTGGSGLGLAIAREVMVLLQGAVEIPHSGDQGTTIEVRIAGATVGA